MTTKDIRRAIIKVLQDAFPNLSVYGDEIAQGFKEPCFFVKGLPGTQTKEIGRRYNRTTSFNIHYFAKGSDDAWDMDVKLYELFENLYVNGDLYRGSGLTGEVVEGVLHFFVDYNFQVIRESENYPKMQELQGGSYLNG